MCDTALLLLLSGNIVMCLRRSTLMPPRFVEFVEEYEEPINMQVEADSESLHDTLAMLLRLPNLSVLKFPFRLEMLLRSIEDEAERTGHGRDPDFAELIIRMDRFGSPEQCMESLVQQLSSYCKHVLRYESLEVQYHNEPAMGPGPVKEFFEVCRGLFSVYPMPTEHEANGQTQAAEGASAAPAAAAAAADAADAGGAGAGGAMTTPERPARRQQPKLTAEKRHQEETKADGQSVLRQCMPLFVPAGPHFDGTPVLSEALRHPRRLLTGLPQCCACARRCGAARAS